MIVPSSRLLLWFSVIVLPLALMGPAFPDMMIPSVLGILGFILLVLIDALFSLGRKQSVGIIFPELIRMSNGKQGKIPLSVTVEERSINRLRIALPFPKEIKPLKRELLIVPPAAWGTSHYEWDCISLKRGKYFIDACYIEEPSFLGLWAVRRKLSSSLEIRVYPNILDEKQSVAAILLNRGIPGMHIHRQIGQGREFERLREYVHGDSYDSIHWKATARRYRPITKVYQIERAQDVYVVIDSSRLSARTHESIKGDALFEAGHESVLERFITAGLVLGAAAERQGDNFGLITFSEGIGRFLRAGNGRAHFNTCKEALYMLQHDTTTPDYNELCSFISMRIRKRALLIFLTSLDDPVLAEGFIKNMNIVKRKHLPVACMIKPTVAEALFSGKPAGNIDDVYTRLGGHIIWHDLQELGRTLASQRVKFNMFDSKSLGYELVDMYTSLKRRQAL